MRRFFCHRTEATEHDSESEGTVKDNFSGHAEAYAIYRPSYPTALFLALANICGRRRRAWDCGTGNGQIAVGLAEFFDSVEATDISERQLEMAARHPRVAYSVQAAEGTSFADEAFDLVVAAQAAHWFRFEDFFAEVERVLAPGGVIALIGYGLPVISAEIDAVVHSLYTEVAGPYWDAERRHIDERYAGIPMQYHEGVMPEMRIAAEWSARQCEGYIRTWSALEHRRKQRGDGAADEYLDEIKTLWGKETRNIIFPLFFRVGTKEGRVS